jgi:hypothetical protein
LKGSCEETNEQPDSRTDGKRVDKLNGLFRRTSSHQVDWLLTSEDCKISEEAPETAKQGRANIIAVGMKSHIFCNIISCNPLMVNYVPKEHVSTEKLFAFRRATRHHTTEHVIFQLNDIIKCIYSTMDGTQ